MKKNRHSMISVIVPVYNAQDHLGSCIDSILDQTYRNLELLLIDDGSTDQSGSICDKYAKRDSRVRVVHKENGGVSSARNEGLRQYDGSYVSFLDADDCVDQTYLEKLYKSMLKYHTDLAACQIEMIYANGERELFYREGIKQDSVIEVNEDYNFCKFTFSYSACAKVFQRRILQGILFDEELCVAEDSLFMAQVLRHSSAVSFISEPLYGYRMNPDSVMHEGFSEKSLDEVKAWKKICRLFPADTNAARTCRMQYFKACRRVAGRMYVSSLQNETGRINAAGKIAAERCREYRQEIKRNLKQIVCTKDSFLQKATLLLFAYLPGVYFRIFAQKEGKQRKKEKACPEKNDSRTSGGKERVKYLAYGIGKKMPRLHPSCRYVVMLCSEETMAVHLERWLKCVDQINGVRLYLAGTCFCGPGAQESRKRIHRLAKRWKKYQVHVWPAPFWSRKWDLIVSPDYIQPGVCRDIPYLYLNHGSHMVSLNGGKSTYAYSREYAVEEKTGRTIAAKALESNRHIAEYMKRREVWKDVVEFTGSKDCDRLCGAQKNREQYRKNFKIGEEEVLVAVFGSWRKNSLFHYMGTGFFDQMQEMQKDGFRFALSVHPMEYLSPEVYKDRSDTEIPVGPMVEKQRERGFLIRDPKEDYLPYIIAADIVISDYSTMGEIAVLADRKLVLSYFDDQVVWKESLIARIKQEAPVLYQNRPIRPVLEQVRRENLPSYQQRYKEELYAGEREYEKKVLRITKELLKTETVK